MSTSVILEGSVVNQSTPDTTWNGTWRFSKDKRGILQFTYKKISKEIPRDLFEYVSFLDPASINDPNLHHSSFNSKSKKRGRGRPRSNSSSLTPMDGNVAAVSSDANGFDIKIEDTTFTNQASEIRKDTLDHEDDNLANPNLVNESNHTQLDMKMDFCDEQNDDLDDNEDDATTDIKPASTEPITILEDHPLMGLWEGSFKVKNVKGVEDTVPETLFLYSTLGSDTSPDFKDLPPEPSFPFCLMKGSQWSAFLTSQLTQKENNTATSAPIDNAQPGGQLENQITEPDAVGYQQTEVASDSSTTRNDATDQVSLSATSTQIKQESITAERAVEEFVLPGGSEPKVTNNPISADIFEEICKRVLIGFGRNAIGRFSVAAVYDETTGEMRCEKKYMTVKHSIKRGRRSYAEYAMAYNNGLSDANSAMPPPVVGIKPQRRYSIDTSVVIDANNSELNTLQTRNRTKSSSYYPYDEDFSIDATPNNANQNGPPSKKKRLSDSATSKSPSAPLSSSSRREGSTGFREKGSKDNREYPTILTEDNVHDIMKIDKNLLIGPRNPDNDLLLVNAIYGMINPKSNKHSSTTSATVPMNTGLATSNLTGAVFDLDTGILYRDAFMDSETGEIYEGEWYNGHRHGRGIVLYADGLMYEGTWLKGKEHGKGDLMLSDRTIVYTGDWYEGFFHGQGTYYYSAGDIYSGDWKEGNRHGRGEYIYAKIRTPALTTEEGSIPVSQNANKTSIASSSSTTSNEVAEITNSSSTRYLGDWRDNRRHGRGRFTWSDGSYYEGDWENDLRHGRGLLELSNGFKYEGNWYRNIMEGKGTCVFPSGQSYQGTFRSGLRDGRGSITFAEGAVYEGRFREDRFDGQGTLKISQIVPGNDADEVFIPVQLQSDLWRIHWKAGFGSTHH